MGSPLSTDQLHIIVLDQGVGEELVGGRLEGCLRLLAVAAFDLDVEHLALPHARNSRDAERLEGTFDRLSLGIEDAGLQRDGDASLHRDRRALAVELCFAILALGPGSRSAPAEEAVAALARDTRIAC